ncbi:FAD-dependent oxidoreductase [Halieaceae bacterium IMCC14734]|uniref:FAD-dependent oxidoreductase n=1 Tax=Candidatus Litorirhabdus singularis TaxID=2518993 RepID=A0ABT3TLP6_9GAMM|nr:FAD-dependent oxidoreductase [Candidatus Litorirhabdus singularis]MCX2982262.1 FAD-dependent oxidoreductase [Candidatus Litorirhabdus singularis]
MTDEKNLSRRSLLLGGGAGLAAASLGGCATTSDASTQRSWDIETDVLVCGSGAAGGTAALYAAKAGARVTVIEKGSAWGGTTAKSGCHIWIPNNFELRSRGVDDDRRACLQYMAQYSYPHLFQPEHPQLGLDTNTFELLAAFYDNGASMVDEMMAWKAFRFRAAKIWTNGKYTPDYFDHSPWNQVPRGRGLEPIDSDGRFAAGKGVVDTMRQALLAEGCTLVMRHRAEQLVLDGAGAVIGLLARNDDGQEVAIRAQRGVVFATGCYSHNQEYLRQYQMDPVFGTCAVPTNEGDFIPIAGAVGAQLANMAGAWRGQVVLEDTLRYKAVPAVVYWPPGDSMLLVDRSGKRCVNEKRGYNDRVRQLYNFDASAAGYPHLLTFMVYDQRTADLRAGNHPIPPLPEAAPYVIVGDTLEQLSQRIQERLATLASHTGGIELEDAFSDQLQATVERFNNMARAGVDTDFGRGNYREDQDWSNYTPPKQGTQWEPQSELNATLYPLQAKGPYYAIILAPGLLGTNGGPKVNAQAEVLDYQNKPISGLYAAGNCMAHPAANAYWAAGATIGSALTFGKIAGQQVALRQSMGAQEETL